MKIAIIKLSSLGDIVHSMVVLQFIKQNYPKVVIDWVVEDEYKELLTGNPNIDNIFTVNFKEIKKIEDIKPNLINSFSCYLNALTNYWVDDEITEILSYLQY